MPSPGGVEGKEVFCKKKAKVGETIIVLDIMNFGARARPNPNDVWARGKVLSILPSMNGEAQMWQVQPFHHPGDGWGNTLSNADRATPRIENWEWDNRRHRTLRVVKK